MIGNRAHVVGLLIGAMAAMLACGACVAQQAAAVDIWRMVPPNSILVAAFDTRPENASMQALAKVEDPEAKGLREKHQAELRKAVEDLATLFGICLDFAKDIQSWSGQQWAFALLPEEKGVGQPVVIIASKEPAAASETLKKLLAPFERVGDVAPQPDSDYPITSFKTKDKGIEVYASAFGPVVAFSPSKDTLKQALKGGGFAPGSPGETAFKALSGSMFSAFVDPAMLKAFKVPADQVPLTGLGMGVSVVETGVKFRVLGFPNEQGLAMLKQALATQQAGALTVNQGIPCASLAAASLPNFSGLAGMAGMFGASNNPMIGAALAISDAQISAALTAALPTPTGVVSAMAASDQAASEKLTLVTEGLKKSKVQTRPATVAGIPATAVSVSKNLTVYLAQSGKYILAAPDSQALAGAVAAVKGEQPGVAQWETYKETIAGLGYSNLLTLYLNLAPVRGLGYLTGGMGLGDWAPIYGSIVKSVENLNALGAGVGFDGQAASITLFLRAKPGIGPTIGPATTVGAAIVAAVVFPVIAKAREEARAAECANNMKQLAVAAQKYALDHGGKLPTSATWQAGVKNYLKVPLSEMNSPGEKSIYAFNKNLSGVNISKLPNPSGLVMFFETSPGLPNASGGRADAILPHNGRGWFAFVDTHTERLSAVPGQSQWVPAAPKPVKKAPAKKAPVHKKRAR